MLILGAIMLSTVWNLNLGHLIAALGVGSIVLGLALQDPLGNLFSGLVLLFERPLTVGDWIKLGDNIGQVVETNWRAVHLKTSSRDLVIIPNAALAKGSFINFSRPASVHRETIPLQFSYGDPPNKVKRVLEEVAQRTPGIIEHPDQVISLSTYNDSGITYDAKVFMDNYGQSARVRDGFQSLVWYAARRHGLTMPYPIVTTVNLSQEEFEAEERAPLAPSALAAFRRFDLGSRDGNKAPVSRQAVQHFAKGEQIIAEGTVLPGIYLILRGKISLSVMAREARKWISRRSAGGNSSARKPPLPEASATRQPPPSRTSNCWCSTPTRCKLCSRARSRSAGRSAASWKPGGGRCAASVARARRKPPANSHRRTPHGLVAVYRGCVVSDFSASIEENTGIRTTHDVRITFKDLS